jgi:hypothetical protein
MSELCRLFAAALSTPQVNRELLVVHVLRGGRIVCFGRWGRCDWACVIPSGRLTCNTTADSSWWHKEGRLGLLAMGEGKGGVPAPKGAQNVGSLCLTSALHQRDSHVPLL